MLQVTSTLTPTAFERAIAGFAGTALHILKGDVAVFIGDDIVFANHAPV